MKKVKISKKEAEKINNEWLNKNGAGYFDFKNKDILLYDGGLFCVIVEKKKVPRTKGYIDKKHPIMKDGEIIGYPFKSPKIGGMINQYDYKVNIWFQELDETINYLKRMKKLLNKLGYKTNIKLTW
jgi:hypothetical protein